MCNVIHLLSSCGHSARLRRSRCKGTKHKVTRTSVRAACSAESFLTLYLQTECSPCQHARWEGEWKSKLESANTFLTKLKERKHIPGVEEVASLVKELNEQYHIASWNMRNMFAHGPKKFVARVNISDHRKTPSPLLQEIRPEDIPDMETKDWTEMVEEDYDGDYVASTDPIHPVSTDYTHPMDDDDGSWVFNHLLPEELELGEDSAVDFDAHQWTWGNDSPQETPMAVPGWPEKNTELDAGKLDTAQELVTGLVAWGPDTSTMSPTTIINMDGLQIAETRLNEQIQQVTSAFWASVNDNDQQSQTNELHALLQNLNITSSPPSSSNSHSTPPTPPSTPPRTPLPWTDGTCDTLKHQTSISSALSTPPPPPPPRPSTPPSPNSTKARYDKQRKFLKQRKLADANVAKYYSDWLVLSRNEIRAFEGAEGRWIPDPPMAMGRASASGRRQVSMKPVSYAAEEVRGYI